MSEPTGYPQRDDADGRAWFYLENRDDIETWAALRGDAALLLERYLVSLVGRLEELAEDLDADPYEADIEAGSWPRFGLRRRSWSHLELGDVTVVAEWERARLLSPTKPWPSVGVRIDPAQTDPSRRQSIAEALAPVRKAIGPHRNQFWPAWRYISPSGDARAVDPEALATAVWVALQECWDLVAPVLDNLHAGSPTDGDPGWLAKSQKQQGSGA